MEEELVPTKACKKCLVVKPLTEFQKAPKCRDGREGGCKACKLAEGNAWRKAHAEQVRENQRRIRQGSGGDNGRIYAREYARAHRDERRIYMVNYNAKLSGVEDVLTQLDVDRQHEAQRGRCWWCSKPLGDDATCDHVVPMSRGGPNTPPNLVLSCRSCNSRKRTRLAYEEWSPPKPLVLSLIDTE